MLKLQSRADDPHTKAELRIEDGVAFHNHLDLEEQPVATTQQVKTFFVPLPINKDWDQELMQVDEDSNVTKSEKRLKKDVVAKRKAAERIGGLSVQGPSLVLPARFVLKETKKANKRKTHNTSSASNKRAKIHTPCRHCVNCHNT